MTQKDLHRRDAETQSQKMDKLLAFSLQLQAYSCFLLILTSKTAASCNRAVFAEREDKDAKELRPQSLIADSKTLSYPFYLRSR